MNPLGFFLGVLTFGFGVQFKDPLRKAAVVTTSQLINVLEGLKTTAYTIKEEFEDIVAEAHYESMKKNLSSGEAIDEHKDTNKSSETQES